MINLLSYLLIEYKITGITFEKKWHTFDFYFVSHFLKDNGFNLTFPHLTTNEENNYIECFTELFSVN